MHKDVIPVPLFCNQISFPLHTSFCRCVAHNNYTSKSHRQFWMTLNVAHGEGRTLNNAQLIPHLQNTTLFVPEGGDLNLSCCALTDDATIEWWFQQTFSSPWIRLANNSKEYHIRSSIDQYEGYYRCSTAYSNQVRCLNVLKFEVYAREPYVYFRLSM